MNEVKKTEFETLTSYIRRMHSRYFRAITAFYTYDSIMELLAPNIVGKEAADNARIMGKYNYFFSPAKKALHTYFLLELSKLFDTASESLHIDKIVNFTKSNLKNLSNEDFKKSNHNRKLIEELVESYKGVQHSDLNSIRKMLDEKNEIIEKLRLYRDKWLAHDDKKKPAPPKISIDEVKILFKIIYKILNTISKKLNRETWVYSHVEHDAKQDFKSLIKDLKEFESFKLQDEDTKEY